MSLDFDIYENDEQVFEMNITHNVSDMWRLAGIFTELYESNGRIPKEIMDNLITGLNKMLRNPEDYEKLNPENGWGSYEGAVSFLQSVIIACSRHPDGKIHISR